MTDEKAHKVLDLRKRTVLQYLSLTDWKMVARLPIPSETTLSRLKHQGWIEIRGKDQRTEAKLTAAGLKAMQSQI